MKKTQIIIWGTCLLLLQNTIALEIGGKTGNHINVTIDDVRIYNRSLTADEI